VEPLDITIKKNETFIITRGVETESQDENGNTIVAKPNACHLRKLKLLNDDPSSPFEMETLSTFEDERYDLKEHILTYVKATIQICG
jgi:hypothetical protein